MPLRTMWILSSQSPCGWAFSSVTRPWVAQRVCPRPIVAGFAATATEPASPLEECSSTAARRFARLPTARTLSISPSEITEMPAES